MNDRPLVSVVIPTFNRSRELRSALVSALQQTLSTIEVLVCDDGSSDDTAQVVRQYQAADPRVVYAPGLASGRPSVPRNRGVHLARGEWVAFLDSDDRWATSKLEAQIAALRRTNASACCTGAYRVFDWSAPNQALMRRSRTPTLLRLVWRNCIVLSSVVVRRTHLLEAGGFPEDPALKAVEDYALWLRLSRLGTWVQLDTPLTHYYDVPASSVRGIPARAEFAKVSQTFLDYTRWASTAGIRHLPGTHLAMAARLTLEKAKDMASAIGLGRRDR